MAEDDISKPIEPIINPAKMVSNLSPNTRLTKKASLKIQKQSYKIEKKKAGNEFKMIAQNRAVVILSDWLKVRSTLKNWSRMWCVLNPGMLILYKNSKQKHWIGTVLLSSAEIIERPSKKQGLCFKVYHIFNQCMWASKGPKGENSNLLSSSLPNSYVIMRAQTESDGQCWIDALELSRNCSNLLKKSMETSVKVKKCDAAEAEQFDSQRKQSVNSADVSLDNAAVSKCTESYFDLADLQDKLILFDQNKSSSSNASITEANGQKQFKLSTADTMESYDESSQFSSSESCYSGHGLVEESFNDGSDATTYIADEVEELGGGESSQVEELADENKSLVWALLKQLRPGMDLSKVVLPTFILEPRSFLDKLSDYYYHSDLLAKAACEENAYDRIKSVTRWYLSGFYKKPKGLKKPYNPILGETFRCKWDNPATSSSTFYISEQVSHHPPVSAFAVINRKDGFTVKGSILAKSKFYGNSISAILDGSPKISLLKHGEDYSVTLPYAHCKGILYGKMTMEFGGKVSIKCEKTGYVTELEFKLKQLFGGAGKLNELSGRILLGKRVLATLSGCWDQEVHITDLNHGTVQEFWSPTTEVKKSRLVRFCVDYSQQGEFESEKLWKNVTIAIRRQDQIEATKFKSILENEQRSGAKMRKEKKEIWEAKYFEYDPERDEWNYKHMDARPWDNLNDIVQFEHDGIISTKTKHKTFPVRNICSAAPVIVTDHGRHTSIKPLTFKTESFSGIVDHDEWKSNFSGVVTEALQPVTQKQDTIIRKLIQVQEELKVTHANTQGRFISWFLMFLIGLILSVFYHNFV